MLTPSHADALGTALRVRGVEPDVARAEGRLVLLDAASTLRTFLVDGTPDRALLAAGVGALVGELAGRGRKVRTAGEMVALLWADGNVAGALALEAAWNELADELGFALLCPYPSTVVETGDLDHVGRLCALHSEVIAPEGYASGSTPRRSAGHVTTEVFVPAPEAVGSRAAHGRGSDHRLVDDSRRATGRPAGRRRLPGRLRDGRERRDPRTVGVRGRRDVHRERGPDHGVRQRSRRGRGARGRAAGGPWTRPDHRRRTWPTAGAATRCRAGRSYGPSSPSASRWRPDRLGRRELPARQHAAAVARPAGPWRPSTSTGSPASSTSGAATGG